MTLTAVFNFLEGISDERFCCLLLDLDLAMLIKALADRVTLMVAVSIEENKF